MVFLIQNTQNRDRGDADQARRADPRQEGAHNALLDLEQLTEGDLNRLRERYNALAAMARAELALGHTDTGHPELTSER